MAAAEDVGSHPQRTAFARAKSAKARALFCMNGVCYCKETAPISRVRLVASRMSQLKFSKFSELLHFNRRTRWRAPRYSRLVYCTKRIKICWFRTAVIGARTCNVSWTCLHAFSLEAHSNPLIPGTRTQFKESLFSLYVGSSQKQGNTRIPCFGLAFTKRYKAWPQQLPAALMPQPLPAIVHTCYNTVSAVEQKIVECAFWCYRCALKMRMLWSHVVYIGIKGRLKRFDGRDITLLT